MARILAAVGACCAGKTTTLDALNELLGWDRLSIDAERESGRDWPHLIRKVLALRTPALIESVAMPLNYHVALKRHDTTIMLVTCDPHERHLREQARRETRPTGRNYSRSDAHFRIDATFAPDGDMLGRLAAMARTPHGRRPAAIE
jgi:hypothetical protein